MLCVMLQHNRGLPTDVINFLLAFHMPAFFVLSGYMLSFASSVNRYAVKDYILKRFIQLMIPYFLFEIVSLLSHLVYYGGGGRCRHNVLQHNCLYESGWRMWLPGMVLSLPIYCRCSHFHVVKEM